MHHAVEGTITPLEFGRSGFGFVVSGQDQNDMVTNVLGGGEHPVNQCHSVDQLELFAAAETFAFSCGENDGRGDWPSLESVFVLLAHVCSTKPPHSMVDFGPWSAGLDSGGTE
jgi:hypothetical protein